MNGFLLLLGSLLIGSHILTFFGLTLPVIRIAGGLVIASVGWKLLSSENDQQNHRATGAAQEHVGPPDSFYPLTMPLTVGPGSIAVAITLGSRKPAATESIGHLTLLAGAAFLGLLASAATIYVSYRFAANITSILGKGVGLMFCYAFPRSFWFASGLRLSRPAQCASGHCRPLRACLSGFNINLRRLGLASG